MDTSEDVLLSMDKCKPNSDIAQELVEKPNLLALPETKISLSEMVALAFINNHSTRIPKDLYHLEKLPPNKQRRIKAAITSTAAKTKHLCNVAYRAHVANWDKKHVIYCQKTGENPDEEHYDLTIGDIPGHCTNGISLPYIVNFLKILCVHGVWDLCLYCKDRSSCTELPVFCLFDKKFYSFWEAHNMTHIFKDGLKI